MPTHAPASYRILCNTCIAKIDEIGDRDGMKEEDFRLAVGRCLEMLIYTGIFPDE